jgi:hypothetical protein
MADADKLPDAKGTSIKLDWSRLLGFDQAAQGLDDVAANQFSDPRLAKLGAKVGQKLSRGR